MKSWLDHLYAAFANRRPFFQDGWGDPEIVAHLLQQDPRELSRFAAEKISIDWGPEIKQTGGFSIQDIEFASPYEYRFQRKAEKGRATAGRPARSGRPETIVRRLPEAAQIARARCYWPAAISGAASSADRPPLVLHFAATGDEGYGRRARFHAIPLARQGIASVVLENAYYGSRRVHPEGPPVRQVLELLQMSRAAQMEGAALLEALRVAGFRQLATAGVSMGGYIALSTALHAKRPVATAALIPSHSAEPVYAEGVLRKACDWKTLAQTPAGYEACDPLKLLRRLFALADMRHHPRPQYSAFASIIAGSRDAYIPEYSSEILRELWPQAEFRWIGQGHVGGFIFGSRAFRRAICASLDRLHTARRAEL